MEDIRAWGCQESVEDGGAGIGMLEGNDHGEGGRKNTEDNGE